MAREVHTFPVTIPAGTPQSAPLTFNLSMPPRRVVEVQVQVPPGPRGEVGFQIGQAGEGYLPYEAGAFIVTDSERIVWPLEDANTSGAWQLIGYNTGQFNHTLYVTFKTDLVASPLGRDPAPEFAESTALSE